MANLSPWLGFVDVSIEIVNAYADDLRSKQMAGVPLGPPTPELQEAARLLEQLEDPLQAGPILARFFYENWSWPNFNAQPLKERINQQWGKPPSRKVDPLNWMTVWIIKDHWPNNSARQLDRLIILLRLAGPVTDYANTLNFDKLKLDEGPAIAVNDLQTFRGTLDHKDANGYRDRYRENRQKWPLEQCLYIDLVASHPSVWEKVYQQTQAAQASVQFADSAAAPNQTRFTALACYCAILVRTNGMEINVFECIDHQFIIQLAGVLFGSSSSPGP